MLKAQSPSRFAVILAFGLVYLFWGSTYLAIDIAVQTIPPALMCALRFSTAGLVMLAVCAATGRTIWYSARQIALAAVVGILLLMGGNLTLAWAELTVPSGLAALIIAITPLWFLVLDSLLLGHHHISGRGKAGLALGLVRRRGAPDNGVVAILEQTFRDEWGRVLATLIGLLGDFDRSEEHTSELQSLRHLVCRL